MNDSKDSEPPAPQEILFPPVIDNPFLSNGISMSYTSFRQLLPFFIFNKWVSVDDFPDSGGGGGELVKKDFYYYSSGTYYIDINCAKGSRVFVQIPQKHIVSQTSNFNAESDLGAGSTIQFPNSCSYSKQDLVINTPKYEFPSNIALLAGSTLTYKNPIFTSPFYVVGLSLDNNTSQCTPEYTFTNFIPAYGPLQDNVYGITSASVSLTILLTLSNNNWTLALFHNTMSSAEFPDMSVYGTYFVLNVEGQYSNFTLYGTAALDNSQYYPIFQSAICDVGTDNKKPTSFVFDCSYIYPVI